MLRLVLLDRDGVLNRELGGYVTNVADFEVLPHVVPNLLRLKNMGCKFIVITNQGGIARQLYDHHTLQHIHNKLENELAAHDLRFEEIYYCPHHPDLSLCLCRKPGSSMVEKALARFGISAHEAVMIGDTERDVEAARGAGVKGYRINSNEDWSRVVDELEATGKISPDRNA
jgi:D-glycero-D-manno-heptose 1,7-bisphosphate phosphatase